MTRITYDHERISFNVARMKKAGEIFEIVIDPDLASAYREGKGSDVREVLHAEFIFNDAKKGIKASEESLETAFHTKDPLQVAAILLKEGELQLTAEYRDKKREEKKRKIIEIIHINAIDPKSGLPHPVTRIENAFEEAKVHVDENKRAEDQVKTIIDQLRPILPIKFDVRLIDVHIPANYAVKLYGIVKNYGKIKREEWQNDGAWRILIEIPAGLQTEFFEDLNNRTHGSVTTKIIDEKNQK
jgi:ribosome maturation protein SDO1